MMQFMTLETNEQVWKDGKERGTRGNGKITFFDSNLAEIGNPSITANFAAKIRRSICGLNMNVRSLFVNLKSCCVLISTPYLSWHLCSNKSCLQNTFPHERQIQRSRSFLLHVLQINAEKVENLSG